VSLKVNTNVKVGIVLAISFRKTVAQHNGVKSLHEHWNSSIQKVQLPGFARMSMIILYRGRSNGGGPRS